MDAKVTLFVGLFIALGIVVLWGFVDYLSTDTRTGVEELAKEVSQNITDLKTYVKNTIDSQTIYVKGLVENQNLTINLGANTSESLEQETGTTAGFSNPQIVKIP